MSDSDNRERCEWEDGNSLQICESSDENFSHNVTRERIESGISYIARLQG